MIIKGQSLKFNTLHSTGDARQTLDAPNFINHDVLDSSFIEEVRNELREPKSYYSKLQQKYSCEPLVIEVGADSSSCLSLDEDNSVTLPFSRDPS